MPTSRWDVSLWDVAKWDEVTHELTADDVESAVEVTGPSLAQIHTLSAEDVESASSGDASTVGQVHGLSASSAEMQSETTSPALVENETDGLAINPTGIGAVIDFRGDEKNRAAQDAREKASKDDLTRIIDEAFNGKPKPETPERTEQPENSPEALPEPSKPKPSVRQGIVGKKFPLFPNVRTKIPPSHVAAVEPIDIVHQERDADEQMALLRAAQKALNDQQALELLLLVA